MDWTNLAFIIPASAAPFYIIAGFIMYHHPPKNINSVYGYRTHRSMMSQQRWDFAQVYSSRQLIIWGFVMLIFSLLATFIETKIAYQFIIGFAILIIFTAIPIARTEYELKQRYRY